MEIELTKILDRKFMEVNGFNFEEISNLKIALLENGKLSINFEIDCEYFILKAKTKEAPKL